MKFSHVMRAHEDLGVSCSSHQHALHVLLGNGTADIDLLWYMPAAHQLVHIHSMLAGSTH